MWQLSLGARYKPHGGGENEKEIGPVILLAWEHALIPEAMCSSVDY
jgi:hypothetical protein